MENIVEQGLLYDFYGELLTTHQRQVYEAAVYDDLSLSEIAGEFGITRQGVHDLLKRCDRILKDYEDHLHLLEHFRETKADAERILILTSAYREDKDAAHLDEIDRIAERLRSG